MRNNKGEKFWKILLIKYYVDGETYAKVFADPRNFASDQNC